MNVYVAKMNGLRKYHNKVNENKKNNIKDVKVVQKRVIKKKNNIKDVKVVRKRVIKKKNTIK